MSSVVIVGALAESLVNFRGDLIRAMVAQGHRVTTMAASGTPECVASIEALGAEFLAYPVARTGRSFTADLRTFKALRSAFTKIKPDIVIAYTIKPVIWAGIAARISRVPRFYALIEGLGYVFQGGSWRRRLLGFITGYLYSISLRKAARVIFLNPDNREFFISKTLIRKSQAALIDGIGVDLDVFSFTPIPSGQPSFLCIARLLGDKGLREYAQAARIVRTRYPEVQINLLGPSDASPDGIPLEEVQTWHSSGVLTYLGEAQDVRPFLANCAVYVLPSYHEGMPRTVLEAMAMGRPIITTDAPGCRETVTPGSNGYLVPMKNAAALADKMNFFIENPDQCRSMGAISRQVAEQRFDVAKINVSLMKILDVHGAGAST
jgi:glycosyltransferase involved in cell wall biosynthesis